MPGSAHAACSLKSLVIACGVTTHVGQCSNLQPVDVQMSKVLQWGPSLNVFGDSFKGKHF